MRERVPGLTAEIVVDGCGHVSAVDLDRVAERRGEMIRDEGLVHRYRVVAIGRRGATPAPPADGSRPRPTRRARVDDRAAGAASCCRSGAIPISIRASTRGARRSVAQEPPTERVRSRSCGVAKLGEPPSHDLVRDLLLGIGQVVAPEPWRCRSPLLPRAPSRDGAERVPADNSLDALRAPVEAQPTHQPASVLAGSATRSS